MVLSRRLSAPAKLSRNHKRKSAYTICISHMLTHQLVRKFLWMVPLLFTSFACNTAAQWTGFPSFSSTDIPAALSDGVYSALPADILNAGSSKTETALFSPSQEVNYLVVYNLNGDELGTRDNLILPANLDEGVDARDIHESIWNYIKSLIPAPSRRFVTEFSILSDGRDNILAGVSPTYDDPSKWTLKVDAANAGDPHILTYALLHEFGHLLNLNAAQIPRTFRSSTTPVTRSFTTRQLPIVRAILQGKAAAILAHTSTNFLTGFGMARLMNGRIPVTIRIASSTTKIMKISS